jgi:valyl-tRNA synthetase
VVQAGRPADYELIIAQWPRPEATVDAAAKTEVGLLIETISAVRSARAEIGVSPGIKLTANIADPSEATQQLVLKYPAALERMGRIEKFEYAPPASSAVLQVVTSCDTLMFSLEGVIDIAAEKARLQKALEAVSKEAKALEGRLNNPAFVEKAKPEAVEKARADHAEKSASSSASSWSCVTNTVVWPVGRGSRAASAQLACRTCASSAPNGSSSSSTRGSMASARASATRWRWPPDKLAG